MNNVTCQICIEYLTSSKLTSTVPCGHLFHYDCIAMWLKKSETCPECRRTLTLANVNQAFPHFSDNDDFIAEKDSVRFLSEIEDLKDRVEKCKKDNVLLLRELSDAGDMISDLTQGRDNIERECNRLSERLHLEHGKTRKLEHRLVKAKHECSMQRIVSMTLEGTCRELERSVQNEKEKLTTQLALWERIEVIFPGEKDKNKILEKIANTKREFDALSEQLHREPEHTNSTPSELHKREKKPKNQSSRKALATINQNVTAQENHYNLRPRVKK